MQLMVYVSTQKDSIWMMMMTQQKLILNETNFMRNETILRYEYGSTLYVGKHFNCK